MAPRANWKGYLRLSLVSCPIALYPATSEREKIRFHNLNSETGNRVRMRRVDEETGDEVPYEQVVSGYEVGRGQYIGVTDEELEAIALESTRTIDIDTFVPKKEIDQLYNIRPYYIAPEGKVGIDAFAVIRDVIEETDKVALGRVVLTSREHVIALEPRGKGLMGTLLRYPYEVRDEGEYFDDISAGHVTKEMLDIAKHIVQIKSGHFKPGGIRRPLRRSSERTPPKEAGWSEDHASESAEADQCCELDGCPAEERSGGRREDGGTETSRRTAQSIWKNDIAHQASKGGVVRCRPTMCVLGTSKTAHRPNVSYAANRSKAVLSTMGSQTDTSVPMNV
jgi:DNA end-binding protein Ku